jgi:hypothetical protein
MSRRYFRPHSLTWWSGVLLIATGFAMMFSQAYGLFEFARVLALFAGAGDASPAMLIGTGAGLIGIRDKIERVMGGGNGHP